MRLLRHPLWVLLAVIGCGGGTRPSSPPVQVDQNISQVDVTISGANPEVEIGKTLQLIAIARTSSSTAVTVASIAWHSSNDTVASVSPAGIVTGLSRGNAQISATVDEHTGGVAVTVVPQPVASIALMVEGSTHALSVPILGLATQDRVALTARALDSAGRQVADVRPSWRVSSGDAVARVTPDGLVTALTPGAASLEVVAGSQSALVDLYVSERDVRFTQLEPGLSNTCGIADSKRVYCWGDRTRLGNGSGLDSLVPAPVASDRTFLQLTMGDTPQGITSSSGRHCWGSDGYHTCGDTKRQQRDVPFGMSDSVAFVAVTGDWDHACGLTADGVAWCWGSNMLYQMGRGVPYGDVQPPGPVSGDFRFKQLSANYQYTCGLTLDGAVYCWGREYSTSSENAPQPVAEGHVFASVATGHQHACGLKADGSVWCWGNSSAYARVSESRTEQPYLVTGGHVFREITAGAGYTCGVRVDDVALCWGSSNAVGSLGVGDFASDHDVPTPVAGGLHFSSLRAKSATTCGISADGISYCWGSNGQGQIGDGTTTNRDVPTLVLRQR